MKIEILGIKIDNLNFEQILAKIEGFEKNSERHYIVTPNPEIVMLAQKDGELKRILNSADLAIPDGIGLILASKILARPLKERITGIDLMERLCQLAEEKGLTVGLLGGKGTTAEKAARILQNEFPTLRLRVFKENIPIVKRVAFLFVAFGAPKQEKWIAKNLSKIPVKVAMSVGGAFEMFAGIQKRAPNLVQKLGLEWLWRLINQPWRIKRQIKLLRFVFLVLKGKLYGATSRQVY